MMWGYLCPGFSPFNVLLTTNNDVIKFSLELMQALTSGGPYILLNHENFLLEHTLIVFIQKHIEKDDFYLLFGCIWEALQSKDHQI